MLGWVTVIVVGNFGLGVMENTSVVNVIGVTKKNGDYFRITMKQIQLTQNKLALVDNENFEYLNQWKWYYMTYRNRGYAVRAIYLGGGAKNCKLKRIWMHRLVMNAPDNVRVDHIDNDSLNNTRVNLRFCSNQENAFNQGLAKNNKSGYRGVSWHKNHKRCYANIRINNKLKFLGSFQDSKDAASIYNLAAKKYFGEFAWLNKLA